MNCYNAGVDLEPDFLGVSRTPKLENLGVRQKKWESAIFLKYNIILSETQTIIITLVAPAEEQIVGSPRMGDHHLG